MWPRTLAGLPDLPLAQQRQCQSGAVDLWFVDQDAIDRLDMAAAVACMSADEQARLWRFHFERDRRLFAAARVLVRSVLSKYLDLPPAAWRFASNEHGKPHALLPAGAPPIHFNLSHVAGLVVCAVSRVHQRLGIDVEPLDRTVEAGSIASHYFSASEAATLQALPPDRQQHEFLALWTLKESYLKARGEGLSLPLAWCSFDRGDDGTRVVFDPRLNDEASNWRFELLQAASGHLVAVAAQTGGAALSLHATRIDVL